MRNPDEMQAHGYSDQIRSIEREIERCEKHLEYLRRTKGTLIERLLEVRSRIVETR